MGLLTRIAAALTPAPPAPAPVPLPAASRLDEEVESWIDRHIDHDCDELCGLADADPRLGES